jgi:hypothetical protein
VFPGSHTIVQSGGALSPLGRKSEGIRRGALARLVVLTGLLAVGMSGCAEGEDLSRISDASILEANTSGSGGSTDAPANDAQGGSGGAAGSSSGGGGMSGSAGAGGGGGTGIVDANADVVILADATGDVRDTGAVVDAEDARPRDARADVVDARADVTPIDAGIVGLQAYWRFDEGQGTVANDSSGNNHTATLTGGRWVTGRVGPFALSLNGTSEFAQATGPVVNTTRPYTVAAWVQIAMVTGFHTAISIDGVSASGFFLQFRDDTRTFGLTGLPSDNPVGPNAIARALTGPTAGTWYHVAGVYDGANLKFYLNGVLQQSVAYGTAYLVNGNTAIGRGRFNGANTDFWPGAIDEVRIYSRALADGEVMQLAQ